MLQLHCNIEFAYSSCLKMPQNPPMLYGLMLCGAYYIGQMGRNVSVQRKEHHSHLMLGHMDKSALVKHGRTTEHSILFNQNEILYKSDQCGPRLTRELLELLLAKRILNREDGVTLSIAPWLPACELLRYKIAEGTGPAKNSP